MGILSGKIDSLKSDPLKADKLRTVDTLSKEYSNIVPEYQKDLGFSIMPGDREIIDKAHRGILNVYKKQGDLLKKYKAAYKDMPTVEVWIMGKGGVETKHLVSKKWADSYLGGKGGAPDPSPMAGYVIGPNGPKKTLWGDSHGLWHPMYGNGRYEIYADGYGKELRDMLTSAQKQTQMARDTMKNKYNFEVEKGKKSMEMIHGKWDKYVADQRAAFLKATKTNDGGIKDLLDSGVLTF